MNFLYRHRLATLFLFSLAGLTTAGLLSLTSAQYGSENRWLNGQAIAFALAFALGTLITLFIRPHRLKSLPFLFYLLAILLLISLFAVGTSVAGHKSWLRLGPLSFQPSEWAKIALVVFLAFRLSELERERARWTKILLHLFLSSLPLIALVILEGDLGTTLILLSTATGGLFLLPFPKKILILMAVLGLLSAGIGYRFFLSPYQKARVQTVLNPDLDRRGSGYQVTQAKITVGSGGFWGKGFLKGRHHQLRYLPARHSDFIFCVFAEEWGFIGSAFLLFCYAGLLSALVGMAQGMAYREGYFMAMLAFWHFLIHITVNLGGVLGLLPLTGIPLPFMSYGGSAVLSNLILLALIFGEYHSKERLLNRAPVKTISLFPERI